MTRNEELVEEMEKLFELLDMNDGEWPALQVRHHGKLFWGLVGHEVAETLWKLQTLIRRTRRNAQS